MAEGLSAFLDTLDFDRVNRAAHGKDYAHEPIYDNELSVADLEKKLKGMPFTETSKNAFLFFMYGKGLNENELKTVFSGREDLFAQMSASHLLVAETRGDEVVYRLNDLSLTSQKLPNKETVYLFAELPKRLRSIQGLDPTAQISSTSYYLLNRLMDDYKAGVKRSGVMADFGAGTGIQAIALLKMYPEIRQAISLEIDGPSMNLNRLNALMNGVADRVQVLDNMNPENLKNALNGRELDFAVSNPPFNIVPHEYEAQFTHFGYGGDHGIEITKIFLNQALPLLKKGGDFVYYSFLAKGEKEYFVTRFLKDNFKGLTLGYDNIDPNNLRYFDLPLYGKAIAEFMIREGLVSGDAKTVGKDIEDKLRKAGVRSLEEKIGRIVKRGDNGPVREMESLKPLRIDWEEIARRAEPRPGGVFIEMHTVPRFEMGGERITRLLPGIRETIQEHKGGVYLERHMMGGESSRRLDRDLGVDFKKTLEALKKDPKFLERCQEMPACAELLKPKPSQPSPAPGK